MSPEDADERELYIIGEGPYGDMGLWRLEESPEQLAIVPKEFPWMGILLYNVMFSGLTGGGLYLALRYGDVHPVISTSLVGGITLLTLGFINRIGTWSVQNAQRLGPWLIVDRVNHIVHLPRHDLSVPFSEVDHLQATTTHFYGAKIYTWKEGGNETEPRAELNLVLRDGNPPARYAILCTAFNYDMEKLARKLSRLTGLPAKRVRSGLFQQDKFSLPYKIRIFETWMTPQGEIPGPGPKK